MYTTKDVRDRCAVETTFKKAIDLVQNDMIEILDISEDMVKGGLIIDAAAEGRYYEEYDVQIICDEKGNITDYYCDCPAYENYAGMCKHCAAVALKFLEEQEANPCLRFGVREQQTDQEILDVMGALAREKRTNEQEANGTIELVPEITEEKEYYYRPRSRYLSFRIGSERKYVLKNMSDFIEAVDNEEQVSYGKQLSFVHCKSAFTETAWKYVQFIRSAAVSYQYRYDRLGKRMELTEPIFAEFLAISLGKEIDYSCEGKRYKTLKILDKNPPLKCVLKEEEDHFTFSIPCMEIIEGRSWLFAKIKNTVYCCSDDYYRTACLLQQLASNEEQIEYTIARKDMPAFCGTILEELEQTKTLDRRGLDLDEFRPKEVRFKFYLDKEAGYVTLRSEAVYGEEVYNLLLPPDLSCQCRDIGKERTTLHTAKAYFPQEDHGRELLYFTENEEDRMYQLLNTGIRQLEELGEVYATERIREKSIIRYPKTQVGVSLRGGLLELSVDSDTFSREELLDILESYRKRKKYYRMKSGDFLNLEDNSAATVAELLDGLGLSKAKLSEDVIELPKFRALYIDQILQQSDGMVQAKRNTEYKELIRNMKNVADSDFAVPESLEPVLRGYQKTGYRWLRTLVKLGFGGILADDMGLGKTLQTIACLLALKEEKGSLRSIIVCPASLVYNWKQELSQFAPELEVKMITGNAQQREEMISDKGWGDVWITSYDMAKRDISLYRESEFDIEIIDEAQNIKNQGTQVARAVKRIQASVKFALTGTPIENRLSELWSIFDYLMPGILGSYDKFRKEYELPIVNEQNTEKMEQLKKIVLPFILRRVKKDVLKELPDKLEQVVYSEMGTEQKRLYTAYVNRTLESLKNKSEEEVRSGKLQILAELTRLRQLCCDPALVYENYLDKACKVETCMELVKEAVNGNHKVLIFSQFTSIFPILEKRLKFEKIAYYVLTGSTPKEQRLQMTESFNRDEVPVFLISLKAGGTGLNLTAASIVIHFDPWWNLAAQNQATDRAHRIGQENQVVVFKLIVKDTIEEKIVQMQDEKQKLSSQILEGEGISASKLTKEDLMEILTSL